MNECKLLVDHLFKRVDEINLSIVWVPREVKQLRKDVELLKRETEL